MTVRILNGDCRDVLATLPDESVHCVVTSPPYWGLRDYGTAKWEGGDTACDHRRFNGYVSGLVGPTKAQDVGKFFKDTCGKCGARRIDSQIGLESSFTEYVETMRSVFAEVRRVLRKDGTCWINLGDSYASSVNGRKAADIVNDDRTFRDKPFSTVVEGLFKPKDLCGIPWRVAFALQADGWYLRSDIIWSKPNPMPESVTDRPTKAHEYLFLLTKSERYYYDAEAIREEIKPESGQRMRAPKYDGGRGDKVNNPYGDVTQKAYDEIKGANRRTVWEIPTSPFPEAHFATFPPALVEPCILAGCPKDVCATCGASWINKNIVGWMPPCSCKPMLHAHGTVLDPFGGAGTTGLVADRLGRNAILIELNPQYAEMAENRLRNDAGMFAQVAAE